MKDHTSVFFAIRNFQKFQHYTDRRPPWIKLYRDLWDDHRFFSLSPTDRYILISLFVLASQNENKIPMNQKWLQSQLLINRSIPLRLFIDTGWIELVEQDASKELACEHDASKTIAVRYPSRARGETETETETEVQRQNPPIVPHSRVAGYSVEFERFWACYPKKCGKGAALVSWNKNGHPDIDTVIAVLEKAKRTAKWIEESGRFIPNPATWINQKRWDDQYITIEEELEAATAAHRQIFGDSLK